MNFKPKTDEEIQAAMLIPEGEKCFAEVKESVDHTSQEGKESIKLKLAIWEDVSIRTYIFVYLTPAFMLLFKHACIALIGKEKYESGNIQAHDFEDKSCDVIIGVKKDKTGKYPDKNIIKDFIERVQVKDGLPF